MGDEERREVMRRVLMSVACDLRASSEFYARVVADGVKYADEAYFQGASDVLARTAEKIADMAKRI
jgi:hypothetical protein